MKPLRRHSLVWLSEPPDAFDTDDGARAAAWQAQGRPFVVTRRRGEGAEIGLGFCTTDRHHPQLRPRRVAAQTVPQHIVESMRPLSLDAVAQCAAARTKAPAFARLQAAASEAGVVVRVYGSWMWQALTDERHVHEASDLDVVIDVVSLEEADRAAAMLAREEPTLAFRIDGELSLADRGEVQWREYHQGEPEIVLKSIDALRLVPRTELAP
ncbi:phosphoribosyl-dephospho-CoA transferase [Enhydrobacter aerosaccus]|uniref:Phosphoribosyl-dephospho-CoA transferase n=1 Tax=Enhydrobacter aerosaccus TaxID=225324 RepID=A0A1T4SYL7_9HYPH|nr:malonate decarboxylase holo-[acyl-carrier-protein] synthase [Enhydrobacter aerosaccus]SKA33295.1 phosphoribosyl-dephospho-CoA transferase [Enhydrobacter aerosaccus]